MLKKTAIAVAAATLMLGVASSVQASDNNSGDYKGPSLFGPLPGQVFAFGRVPGGYYASQVYGRAFAPQIYGRALGYAPIQYPGPYDFPPGSRWHWENY
jgi:hypothetical protein